jgi:hypothetical protein
MLGTRHGGTRRWANTLASGSGQASLPSPSNRRPSWVAAAIIKREDENLKEENLKEDLHVGNLHVEKRRRENRIEENLDGDAVNVYIFYSV